ncbi:MAG: aminotransferase class V-fold PLP-dependent enzyme [Bacteroidales bacterium]|jgi:cysteine desulfurase
MKIQLIEILKHVSRKKRNVYLDHNATTPVSRKVRRKMNSVLKHNFGNPSSLYSIAGNSVEILDEARQRVAGAIHAYPEEIIFTGCATESNNAILKSLSNYFYPEKKKIISTPIEHSSVINTLEFLKTRGIVVEYCPVDRYGRVLPDELKKLIDNETFLICCMLANNEIGTIQDIQAITRIACKYDVLVMSDCVQALGKIPVDVHELGVDFASFSAHKLYGPKGTGALYIKMGSPFEPFLHGGQQEEGLRAGTESIHNIAGFGAACGDINKLLAKSEVITNRKMQFILQIRKICPECIINSPESDCVSNTINITFPNIKNEGLMAVLDYHGITVSGGAACSAHEDNPSHVLKAIGLSDKAAEETIRFSLGPGTLARDIRYTMRIFQQCVNDRNLLVDVVSTEQLDRGMLFDDQTYILDVRPGFLRKMMKSLPNSHEASFFSIKKYLDQLPKDKNILVVCQHGNLSYITAYYLRSKGFGQVSSLWAGLAGWKEQYNDLYREYAGQNIRILKPAG